MYCITHVLRKKSLALGHSLDIRHCDVTRVSEAYRWDTDRIGASAPPIETPTIETQVSVSVTWELL